MCGEHAFDQDGWRNHVGSSPRVRGTRRLVNHEVLRAGIIPACAGNTDAVICWDNLARDHPRVCGEHQWPAVDLRDETGSSPRVRGTLRRVLCRRYPRGIIPACAGNTPPPGFCTSPRRDHPRVCGEHLITAAGDSIDAGSSPRVRGTLGAQSP